MKTVIPKYEIIANHIKEKILSEELKPNDAIFSEHELSAKFEVSRMTARRAVSTLVNAGIVYRVKGKGSFVKSKKLDKGDKGLKSFTEEMKEKGLVPSSKLLNFEIINSDYIQSDYLYTEEGTSIYKIQRLMLANNEPMAYEIIYRDIQVTPGLERSDFDNKSVYRQLIIAKIVIDHADQEVEAIAANQELANILEIEVGTPVLLIQSRTYSNEGEIIQFTKSYYRADKYIFNFQTYRK